jgi:hypothetical protein
MFAGVMTNTSTTISPNPTRSALRTLASWQDGPFVSIFLPQDPKRPDMDATHLKDIVQWALGALVSDHGLSPARATSLLAPITDATLTVGVPGHGTAWFLAPERSLRLELPGVTAAVVEIGGAPDTLRLLTHLSTGPDYYVLAVSQKHARVFRANRFSIEPFDVAELPKSLDDALWYIQREPTFERHGSGAVHASGGGQQYHKDDIHQYLHQVDRALCAALAGSHAPLVVMGVGYEASMYINESHYRHVVHTPVSGNPDALDLATIHQRSWAEVSNESGPAGAAASRVRDLAGTGRAITAIDEIVEASQNGAVDQFVVARSLTDGGERRGRLDADRERLSTALIAAMAHGAAAHVVADDELPSGAVAAAVLRF